MNALIKDIGTEYKDYLIDESRFLGKGSTISFPQNIEEIKEVIGYAREHNVPVTVQGGKTGIVGAGIPLCGHLMNLSRFNHIISYEILENGEGLISVEPGITLMEINDFIRTKLGKERLFLPVQPTEKTASIGGIIATDGFGPEAYYYGKVIDYIEGMDYLDSSYEIKTLTKGDKRIRDIIGSEGSLGVITELKLRLIKKTESAWIIVLFFNNSLDAMRFSDDIIERNLKADGGCISAFEYLDRNTVDIIENHIKTCSLNLGLPEINSENREVIFLEIKGQESAIEEITEYIMEVAGEYNCDLDDSWALCDEVEIERMNNFRHLASEAVNGLIDKAFRKDNRIHKLSSDGAESDRKISDVLNDYVTIINKNMESEKKNLNYSIFGHVGTKHLHVNIIPESYDEFLLGQKIITEIAENCSRYGGNIAEENGIGKVKKRYVRLFQPDIVNKFERLKREYDPSDMFNKGNILDEVKV